MHTRDAGCAYVTDFGYGIGEDLFLQATAFRLNYTGSGFSVPTPPVQLILLPVQFGQGGVWDLDVSSAESSRSLPLSDAVEETNLDSVQSQSILQS